MLLFTLPFLAAYSVFPLTMLAAVMGGWYVLIPFWSMLAALDTVMGDNLGNPDPWASRNSLWFGNLLTWLWGPTQLVMYAVVAHQFFYSDHLELWEKLFIVFAAARATAIGISVGHDLLHRRSKWEKRLGEAVLGFAGLGYYKTEHIYVHHTHVCTPRDPVTARKGEGLYRYLSRVWPGTIANSWRVDRERLRRRGLSAWHRSNPWWQTIGTVLLMLAAFWCAAAFAPFGHSGWEGVALYLGAIAIANVNLRGVDYIEHYGLLRLYSGKGRFEHARPHHAWNSARRMSAYILFNVQRHADHHYKPMRPYPLLQTYGEDVAPQMPFNYVVMFWMAMIPPLWRRVMDPRVEAWRRKFYPEVEDWSAYESPLFYEYPDKYPVIAEVMAKDARLAEWMHRHPAVLEGKYTPEQSHLSLADLELDEEWGEIAQRGLVTVFYRRELTPTELEEQLSALTQGAENMDDTTTAVRPWLEDRSFQLGLHLLRRHLEPENAAEAFNAMIEVAVLHLAQAADREFDAEFDEASSADAPALLAEGAFGRREMAMGDALELSARPGEREGAQRSGADLERFQKAWATCFLHGLARMFDNDFPCRFAGTLAEEPAGRQLRP